jgi:hypothetical protein
MKVIATGVTPAVPRMRKPAIRRWVAFAAVLLAALAGPGERLSSLSAQNQDVSAQFPEPAQVTADYPDDAERWGAFNVLHQALYIAAPRPMSKPAYTKSFAYEAAYNGIVNTFIANRGAQNQAYKDFNARCDKLFSNSDFGQLRSGKISSNSVGGAPARGGRRCFGSKFSERCSGRRALATSTQPLRAAAGEEFSERSVAVSTILSTATDIFVAGGIFHMAGLARSGAGTEDSSNASA